jgi:flagellar motor switch protein FliG
LAEEENVLSGAQKSAILLLAMGEEAAVSVMRNMRDDEVSQIGEAAAGLAALNVDTAEKVLEEFSEIIGASFNLTGSDDYVYRLSVRAFGEDKAAKLLKENRCFGWYTKKRTTSNDRHGDEQLGNRTRRPSAGSSRS